MTNAAKMSKERLAAFSDGVIAIIITIMVLELKIPHSADPSGLIELLPIFLSYALSFLYVAIYWINHHHLLNTFEYVNGGILWSNTLLLFCLSLVPFATGWADENFLKPLPMAFYGCVLLASACAYYILQLSIIKAHGPDSTLAKALGSDVKGRVSLGITAFAIFLAYVHPLISLALYVIVPLMWVVPDRRIERVLR